ncbi:Nuclear poly(A) polymerase 1 [Diplonema papillatum]|nr:Nuclear poly(A) polymerase 1 [Diplonema papillatum]
MPDYRGLLTDFFARTQPDLISGVDGLLAKFKGREEELLRRCRDRYCVPVSADVRPEGDVCKDEGTIAKVLEKAVESDARGEMRQNAVRTIERAFKEWTKDSTSQVIVFGSVALDVYLPGSDTDLVCVTSSPRCHHFFSSFSQHLAKQPGVEVVLSIPLAMPPLLIVTAFGVQHDVLFCYVPSRRPLPANFSAADDECLVNMDDGSRKALGGPRLLHILRRVTPNFDSFRLALKAIKVWSVRRGIQGTRYGFPGGVAWVTMVCAAARRCPPNAPPEEIVLTFFNLFHKTGLRYPISIVEVPPTWRRGPDDKLCVLVPVPAPPSEPLHMINTLITATDSTIAVLQHEIDRAALLCRIPGGMADIWQPADFFSSCPRFLQIETRAISRELLEPWVSFVSSRYRELLKLMDAWLADGNRTQNVHFRMYPYTFRSDHPNARLDSTIAVKDNEVEESGDFAGYTFVGLRADVSPVTETDEALAAAEEESLLASLAEFVSSCDEWMEKRGGMFEPSLSIIERKDIPAFVLDEETTAREPGHHKRIRSVDDVVRGFRYGGVENIEDAHFKKLRAPAPLNWLPGDCDDSPILPKDSMVLLRAVDGDGEYAWVRTEEGNEGFVKQDVLIDFAMASVVDSPTCGGSALHGFAVDELATPLTPSATIMKTKGDSKLRMYPVVAPCVWVEDCVVPDGSLVTVSALDREGEFALVQYDKYQGFIRTSHLCSPTDAAHWVKADRARYLKQVVEKAHRELSVVCVGVLTAMEASLLSLYAAEKGLRTDAFAERQLCYPPPKPFTFFPTAPADDDGGADTRDIAYSGLSVSADSAELLVAFFEKHGLLPGCYTRKAHRMYFQSGPLNDPNTEGQELTFHVVATGTSADGVAAGVIGTKGYTILPTPHVVVAVNPHAASQDSSSNNGTDVAASGRPYLSCVTWDFLPPEDVFTITGTVQQFRDNDTVFNADEDFFFDKEVGRHYSFSDDYQ